MHISCLSCLPCGVKSEKPRKNFYKIESSEADQGKEKEKIVKKSCGTCGLYLSRKECSDTGWDFERLKVLRQILINYILHFSSLFPFLFSFAFL